MIFGGGDDMHASRRMENSLGWYPGPFLIGLTSIASDVGYDAEWFERIMSEGPRADRKERQIPMDVVESLCWQIGKLSAPTPLSEIMRRQMGFQMTSLVSLSLGEPTLKAVLIRAADTSLLNANLFTYRFENLPSRKAYALTFLPIVPIPRWLHVCFAYQFAEGLARTTSNEDIEVEEVVLCGARLACDLDALTDGSKGTITSSDSAPSRIIYKAKSLDQLNEFANRSWRNLTNSLVNPLLSSRLKATPWTYRCYVMILRHFEAGASLSMEAISNSLGADVSTLRRHLQRESTGFKPLITFFRAQQAQLMMIDGVSAEQIAQRLDFKNALSVKRLVRRSLFCPETTTAFM